ncbi:MAG TPA: DinB family protein [Gemmataceae bacterium]|nr:DinB family protein [Gemmataceae bacterium]
MTPNDTIAAGYRMAAQLLRRMTSDLTPDEFLHQPLPGTNCAAWIVGHLALTMHGTLKRLGVADPPAFPDGLAEKLKITGPPAGKQGDYGDPKELLRLFDACVERLMQAVRTVPTEVLTAPADGRPPFANTRGEAMLFGSMHLVLHCGQLSTNRRSLGKPPGA